ncbi:hypothetical protein DVH05_025360 [Phytophthora capsici]|nr:hypothetical protein DVH05_025360 [Phytophthora capsici]
MALEIKSPAASPIDKDPAYVAVTTPDAELAHADQEVFKAHKYVQPTYILYTSAMLAFVLPLQFGWSTSQLNLRKFNNVDDCNARPVVEGTCIMFPGHTKFQWTIVVNAWIFGGMIGAFLSASLPIGSAASSVVVSALLGMLVCYCLQV